MTDVSAYDPSSWSDVDEDAKDELLDRDPQPERGPATIAPVYADMTLARAELDDLRELQRSTRAQLDKAEATSHAAASELDRLTLRIEAVQQEIADAEAEGSDTEGEG